MKILIEIGIILQVGEAEVVVVIVVELTTTKIDFQE
jgi:hypothetical protein